MGLALRLFLLLLLAVALPARAAQAAPLQARGADELARKVSPAAWLQEDFQPLKPPAGEPAGRTFQAPFLIFAHKPSSHPRGPLRGRKKPTKHNKPLEESKQLDQILSDLDRRREMEGEAVLKAQFPGGSRGSLAASAAGREAMAGTVTGDWDRDLHHLGMLVKNGLRMLELGEGPPSWMNKDTGDKKSLEAAKHLDKMLSDLERRREMNRKAVLKTELPGGSRGSLAASAAGREAMPGPVRGDESAGRALPAAGMKHGLEPLGDSAGVSAGRVFPGPLVDVAHKPSSHPRGPLRGRKKPTKHNKPLEESKQLDQILSDLERRHEMDQKSFRKAALPGGINGPVLATDTGSEEMPDSATEDVVTEEGIYAPDPVRLPRIVCPQDVRRKCMIGTVVIVFTVPLLLLGCYLGICKLYEIRRAFYRYLI